MSLNHCNYTTIKLWPVFVFPFTNFAHCLPFSLLVGKELEEESDMDAPVSLAELKKVSVVLVDCYKHTPQGKDEEFNQDGELPGTG